jgi:hypothetical protein
MRVAVSEERKESFKKGLGSAEEGTRRRDEQMTSIRKQKRDDKLELKRRRRRQLNVGPGEAMETDDGEGDDDLTVQRLVSQYNKAQLLSSLDLNQLVLLDRILKRLDTVEDLEQYYERLFGTDAQVLSHLVNACCTSTDAPRFYAALTCLINVTGFMSNLYSLRITMMLFEQSSILRMIYTHLEAYYRLGGSGTKYPIMEYGSGDAHSRLWELVINLIYDNPEARDAVVSSPLFANMNTSPFSRAIATVFNDAAASELRLLRPVLISLICTIIETPLSTAPLPVSFPFVLLVWKHITVDGLYTVQPVHDDERSEYDGIILSCTTRVIACLMRAYERIRDDGTNIRLIQLAGGLSTFMRKLSELAQPVVSTPSVQRRIVEIFRILSALPCPADAAVTFQAAMVYAGGAIPLMLRSLTNRNADVRAWAFLWAGNYMADGVQYVQQLMGLGIVDSMVHSLNQRSEPTHVHRKAVYALMTMFCACDKDKRSTTDPIVVASANGILRTLTSGIFKYLEPFLHRNSDPETCVDVLNVVCAALKWDHQLTIAALEDADALDHISDLVGSQNTAVYNAACAVEARLSSLSHGF